jgi:transcriptional regulator with XRE-family HTH domain
VTAVDAVTSAIATNTRSLRLRRGWSLDALSGRSGLSKGMLLQIEQGRTNPSIATLCRLCEALGVALSTIVEPVEATPVRTVDANDVATLWRGPHGGSARLLLGTDPPVQVEVWEWELAAGETFAGEPHPVGARELLSVRSGTLTLDVAGTRTTVRAGGAAHFLGDRPHSYANDGEEVVRFTMVFLLAAPVDDPVEVRSAPALRVHLMPGRYAVSRHAAGTPVRPVPSAPRGLWSVTVTDDEVSYVTLESEAPADATAEPGWRALQVAGPLGFELVGVLSALTAVLA